MVRISLRPGAVTCCLLTWCSLSLSKPIIHSASLALKGGSITHFLTNIIGTHSFDKQHYEISGTDRLYSEGEKSSDTSNTTDSLPVTSLGDTGTKVEPESAFSHFHNRHGSSHSISHQRFHTRRALEKRGGAYTVKSGDTGDAIAAANGISFDALSAANPGVNWNDLQVGQTLNLPGSSGSGSSSNSPTSSSSSSSSSSSNANSNSNSGSSSGSSSQVAGSSSGSSSSSHADAYHFYQGATSSDYPSLSNWQSFEQMWAANEADIGATCSFAAGTFTPNTQSETQALQQAISSVSSSSGVSAAYILAIVMQESNGCVRVPTTASWQGIRNPGLMQTYQGQASCNNNGQIQTPCPDSEILAMIQEGVNGNQGVGLLPAMKTAENTDKVSSEDAMVYYQAARIYNSGSLPADGDLSGESQSTACYVSDVINRLMGWVRAPNTCGD